MVNAISSMYNNSQISSIWPASTSVNGANQSSQTQQSQTTTSSSSDPYGTIVDISEKGKSLAVNFEQQTQESAASSNESDLSDAEQREVDTLEKTDKKVRAHEQAHLNAAGGLAISGAKFSYTTGPDGVRYVTGGEVSIDSSPVKDDPQATIQKAERIIAAALAPVDPSSQDRSVASAARSMEATARQEIAQQQFSAAQSFYLKSSSINLNSLFITA